MAETPGLGPQPAKPDGFSLVELIAVIAIIAVAASVVVPVASAAMSKADRARCLSKMRSLGTGIGLCSLDNGNEFPRSSHSAGRKNEISWQFQIYTYLGEPEVFGPVPWANVFNRHFRCPADPATDFNIPSYAMNVFFELSAEADSGDSYAGSPTTWRKAASVPRPARTVLLAEPRATENGDHFMCHEWSSLNAARNAVAWDRHSKKSNYLFVDGHVESLRVEDTFDPAQGVNLWNPSLAK